MRERKNHGRNFLFAVSNTRATAVFAARKTRRNARARLCMRSCKWSGRNAISSPGRLTLRGDGAAGRGSVSQGREEEEDQGDRDPGTQFSVPLAPAS